MNRSNVVNEMELQGRMNGVKILHGVINAGSGNLKIYEGDYEVIPKARVEQTLETKDKLLRQDVKVTEIPFYQVQNPQGGNTIYIGGND